MIKKITNNKLLLAIILSGALLRLIGINPGYPPIHADEGITHSQGIAMILERTLDPKYGYGVPYNYPIVVPLINAFSYLFFFIPLYSLGYLVLHFGEIFRVISQSNFDGLAGIFEHNILGLGRINVVFWGRYTTALFGTGIILLGYFLGKKLFKSYWVGILSALFISVNYRQVLNSHFGLPDIYNAFFLCLALFSFLLIWEKQTLKRFVLAGISVAIFFSTKFQFFAIPPLVYILFLLTMKQKKWIGKLKVLINCNVGSMVIVLLITVLFLNVFHILHWRETTEQVGYSALKYGYGVFSLDFYSLSYLYHIGLGQFSTLLVAAGIILGLIFETRRLLFLLSVTLPFFFVMIYYTNGGYYTRNFVTITPVLLICGAFGFYQIIKIFKKMSNLLAVLIGLIMLIFVAQQSLVNSVIVPMEYTKEWNNTTLQKWLGKALVPNAVVLTDPSMVLPQKKLKIIKAVSLKDYQLADMQDNNVKWSVINSDWFVDNYLWWMRNASMNTLRFWDKPVEILSNSPLSKEFSELLGYVVFESINPWQAPDNNFLVIKVPPRIIFGDGKIIYQETFDDKNNWNTVNDGYGNLENFFWDGKMGFNNPGSLAIYQTSGGMYSQRFVSPKIPALGNYVYKISGIMRSEKKLAQRDRDGFLGVDFLSEKNEIIKTSLSQKVWGSNQWILREIVSLAPPNTKYLQLFFQAEASASSFWSDDVKIWQSRNPDKTTVNEKMPYINPTFNLQNNLFLNSNGGM